MLAHRIERRRSSGGGDMPRIPVGEILNDIQNGMGDHELAEKYQLSIRRLKRLMDKLVEKKAISHRELYEKSPVYRELEDQLACRDSPRIRLLRSIQVYHDETAQMGFVRDISENGLRIAGIKAAVGDVITLRLPLDEVGTNEPIAFVAECRWSKIEGKHRIYAMCGFEITEISEKARIRFQELTDLLVSEIRGWDWARERELDVQMSREVSAATGTDRYDREFSGEVDGVDILDVVQFLLLIGKTTVLRVISSQGAESLLYLKDGALVHADLGSLQGQEAFFECMDFPGGEFSLEPWCEPIDQTIDEPGELLLVEAARRRDESRR
jgi:hypothetical protein